MNWIAEVLEEHLKENPEHHFLFDEQTPHGLTFKEFYDLSGRVYAYLKANNIGKEDFVLINLERGVKPFVALMGVWRSGAAFTIVENTDPSDRIKYIYENCSCKLEINEKVWEDILKTEPLNGYEEVDEHDGAYAVYTSGTTGKPKGIIHEYGNLKETCNSAYYSCEPIFAEDENFAFIASLNFAVTIILFLPIFNLKQSQFHVCSQSVAKNFKNLKSYSLEKQITGMFLPPSYIRTIGEVNWSFLKKILVASEPANGITPPEGVLIYNAYSTSESVFWSCVFKIDKKYDICPVGQPQFDKKVYLKDENGNEVTDGQVGEFCFDNPFVRGYINLPEENKRAFQNRIYHSNDLAKRLPNGDYVIIGRKNDMVKINGNRVEPAEVEAVIRNVLNIDWCGVRGFEEDENAYLAAYYTADISIDINEIREKLSEKLPYYMLPAHFIKIDKIPVNRNGKFDRRALPIPELKAENIILPETEFEKMIFDVVSKELKIKDFGVTTNLISMGLTSIKAIKLSALINKETNYSIKTGDILSKPYIREWFNFVDKETEKIEILEKQETYPLTPNQLGIYIDWERNRDGLQYNIPTALKLNNVEPEKLLDSLKKVIELHPYFKVHIEISETGEVVQVRRDNEQLSVVFEKLNAEPDKEFFQSRVKPFDLLKDDLSRFEIYYTENNTYLFFDIHHILFDGTSVNILLSELLKLYNGENIEQEQVTAYDYSLYLKNWKETVSYEKSENYFSDLISYTDSFIYPSINSNAQPSGKSATYVGEVSKQGIKNYCSNLGITENAFFATVLTQVFHRISREGNIQISTISSGRSLEQLSNTIGMFVQTLPLVSKKTKGNISEILTSMQEQIISTINNDKYPYTELVEKYDVKPNILYAYQGDVINKDSTSKFEQIQLELDTTKTPISINIIPEKEDYSLIFEYDSGLYTNDEIEKLSASISNFATNITKQTTDTQIETISLVSEEEQQELITLGTGEKLEYDKTKTFVDLFIKQVKENPDNIAVVDYKSSITYEELDRKSNILANVLIEKGVTANDFIAVKLPRIKEFMVAVISIWKTGAAYVPIDLSYPQERINYMLEDSQAKVVIDEEFLSNIDFEQETKPINLTTSDNLAYMIYTSGSTGKPKGVMISQESLMAFVIWLTKELDLKQGDNVAEYSSFSFDASLCDLYTSLLKGSTLHILGNDLIKDFSLLEKYINSNQIIGATLPTQLGMDFVNESDTNLRYLSLGGDKLKLTKETPTRIYNGYGPTEFTVWATSHIVDFKNDTDNIPIGKAVPNAIVAVVDRNGNLLPRGIDGELVLIGPQVSKGYWKRPELTKEKFVDCPFLQGQKMYRTGDLVRWNENNELLFIGRIDNQVKLRGFRIELGEIESVLSKIEGIKSCVVEVKTINDIQHLIAYYVSDKEGNEDNLKEELSKTLTEYMVPDIFVKLDEMPMTPNGKVNRKSLPIPELKAENIILPETEFEKMMFDVVSKELKIKDFGVTTNLISMGLTSIKAIKLSALINKETNYSIKTGDILSKPYIREWFNFVDKETEKIEILEKQETYPLTPNQLGIYIDWERNRDGLQYNIPTALKLNNVEPEKLLDSLKKVIELHPYFKVHIEISETGEVVQVRRDNEQLSVVFEKLNAEPDKEFFQSRVKPFDLLKDDLSRFEIYYTEENTYLFIDIHHILFDGTSVNILLSELFKAYNEEEVNKEQATAYDYSLFLENWKQSENYTKSEQYFRNLIENTDSLMYPSINVNAQATNKSETYQGHVNKQQIKEYCSKLGITENAFFATVLTQVFHRISREENIQISTISSGRSLEQLSNTIGMFVQTLPLVSKNTKGSIKDLLNSMQEQIISTINNDKYPYTELVEKYDVKPNILYAYQGDVINKDSTSKFEQIPLKLDTTKTPISINIIPEREDYSLIFEYDSGLYTNDEIEKLSNSISNFATNITKQTTDTQIETISLVSEKEEQDLITLGTGEKLEYDKTKTFVDLFIKQVKENPDNIAVVDYKSSITYEELDRKSNILANVLIKKGVKPNDFVAIKLPRIKEFLVSVIAIWKSGAAYVPIDLSYPQNRINYMLEDSQAKVVIDEEFLSNIDFEQETKPINLTTPDNLAYMIYTSGSTGKPKGVMISHTNLAAYCCWKKELLKVTSADTFAHYISFSFDASLEDFIASISSGSAIHILSEEIRTNTEKLKDYIVTNNNTILALPTQLGTVLANEYNNLPIRYLTLGGEKLSDLKETSFNVINGYGPTEFTVCSDYHIIDFEKDKDNIPIGRPVPNSISAVVDKNGNFLPRGIDGELVLIGSQISRGYWNREDLTKEKFVDCPFIKGQKMYKTGDLVRWNEDGDLLFIGRIDNQVKLRGFRIELGEIDSVLSKINGIKSCAVEVKTINDIQHLIAYYVSDNEINSEILKQELSKTLTEYMVPDIFVHLDKMPLTPNGKIDRRALPIPPTVNTSEEYIAPQNETEKIICDIFGNILSTDNYSVTGDFFKSGGTSINAIRVVGELQKYNFDVVYGDIFKYKTPRELANYFEGAKDKKEIPIFDFGDYDYTKINSLLEKSKNNLSEDIKTHSLGDILLTGATGFLGVHILKYLLKSTDSKINLLIRQKGDISPKNRILTTYFYYFDKKLIETYNNRITIIEGDITDKNLHNKLANYHYDTVFNCAALVKHFIADDLLDKINVEGLRNLIECCSIDNATLIHISTSSVGAISEQNQNKIFDEHKLYIGQVSSNDYIRTKFLAERYLLEAIASGKLNGKIMRLGNLMGRISDGEFQMNFNTNAFVNFLKSYAILGVYPKTQLNTPIEMSPIDLVAQAVVKLATTPNDMLVFHPYNEHNISISTILDEINKIGYNVDYVEDFVFTAKVKEFRDDPKLVKYLQGILHYAIHQDENKGMTKIDNRWTTSVLNKLGFSWSKPDEQYLDKFLQLLDKMNFFEL